MELDEHEVVWDRYRTGPFAGLTLARARVVNDVLWGFPVRVWSHDDLEHTDYPVDGTPRERQLWRALHRNQDPKRSLGEFGVFLGMTLPGHWADGWAQVFDIRIATSVSSDGTRVGSGSSRVMGLGAVGQLEVLEADAWHFCSDCGSWRPGRFLMTRDPNAHLWADDPDDAYYRDLVCRQECQ